MVDFMLMPSIGSCVEFPGAALELAAAAAASPATANEPRASINIGKAVGVGPLARNLPDDVKVIQDALNRIAVKGEPGSTLPFLVVDGICGARTNAAIQRFQQVQLKIFDGVVEPDKNTMKRINEILGPDDNEVRSKIAEALPIVAANLNAALANLSAIISEGPGGSPAANAAADRLSRHFQIDRLGADEASLARVDLFRSYTRFFTAILRTDLFDATPFDDFDFNRADPFISLVTRNGFFLGDKPVKGVRLDHIHLGRGFFAANVDREFAAFIIIHELTHFVGRSDGVDIIDHGRGWFDDTFIKPLDARKRLANADSYATFAHECRTQTSAKPGFVKTAPGGLKGRR